MSLKIRQAIVLMENDMQKDWSLTKLARSVNLTPEHLCRSFKAETGESPLRYRKRLRLQKAKELLETPSLSVKEIMHAVGIHDASNFVRDFEKHYGLAPAQYRARYLGAILNCTGPNNQEIKIG